MKAQRQYCVKSSHVGQHPDLLTRPSSGLHRCLHTNFLSPVIDSSRMIIRTKAQKCEYESLGGCIARVLKLDKPKPKLVSIQVCIGCTPSAFGEVRVAVRALVDNLIMQKTRSMLCLRELSHLRPISRFVTLHLTAYSQHGAQPPPTSPWFQEASLHFPPHAIQPCPCQTAEQQALNVGHAGDTYMDQRSAPTRADP